MWSSSQLTKMSSNRVQSTHQNRQKQVVYKYVKPSQPIYRPPSARVNFNRSGSPESHSSSTTSTSQSNETNKFTNKSKNFGNSSNVSVPSSLKSALKRSKSFGHKEINNNNNNNQDSIAQLMSIDGISWESVTLVRRAIEKTNSLTMNQLMQIVRILCNKALEKSCYARPLAVICLTINEKQSETQNHLFIESLINCLREWFTERDKLRLTSGGARRWTAYVTFISELYLNIKIRGRLPNTSPHTPKPYFYGRNDDFDDEYDLNPNRVRQQNDSTICLMIEKQQKHFSILLFDSMQAILMNPNSTPTEIECLQSVLRCCGKYLEEENPLRIKTLMFMIRDLFLSPFSSNLINCQKLFLEIIELSSSKWNFNQSQLIYYFPYTKQMDI